MWKTSKLTVVMAKNILKDTNEKAMKAWNKFEKMEFKTETI